MSIVDGRENNGPYLGIDVCPKLTQVYSEWRMFVSPNMIRVDKSQEQRMIVDRGEFSEEILRSAFEDRDGSEARNSKRSKGKLGIRTKVVKR